MDWVVGKRYRNCFTQNIRECLHITGRNVLLGVAENFPEGEECIVNKEDSYWREVKTPRTVSRWIVISEYNDQITMCMLYGDQTENSCRKFIEDLYNYKFIECYEHSYTEKE